MFTFRIVRKTLLVASITTQKQLGHFQFQMFFFYFIDCTILTNLYFKQNEKKKCLWPTYIQFHRSDSWCKASKCYSCAHRLLIDIKKQYVLFHLSMSLWESGWEEDFGWQCCWQLVALIGPPGLAEQGLFIHSVLEGSAAWDKSSSVQDNFLLLWAFF